MPDLKRFVFPTFVAGLLVCFAHTATAQYAPPDYGAPPSSRQPTAAMEMPAQPISASPSSQAPRPVVASKSVNVAPQVFQPGKSAEPQVPHHAVRQAAHHEPIARQALPAQRSSPVLPKPGSGKARQPVSLLPSILTMVIGLGAVLGLFFGMTWLMRRARPQGIALLPADVLQVLGRAPLAAKQQVQLLRCGNKLLLVAVSMHGLETLTEITDPIEVDRLAGLCEQNRSGSSTTAFRQVLQTMISPPATPGFLGTNQRPTTAAARTAPLRPANRKDDDV